MKRNNGKTKPPLLKKALDEASWLLSHAEALSDYGRADDAVLEWGRAAAAEEEAACLLEERGSDTEAALHRVSAAACLLRIGNYPHAATHLRAALTADLTPDFRAKVQNQLRSCLGAAKKRAAHGHASEHPRRAPKSRAVEE
ncbi:MAG: hypothetical protein HY040_04265 [Planctomycetes bacterium]|nr:hypothetical protein [Planctomycetota bacterium]